MNPAVARQVLAAALIVVAAALAPGTSYSQSAPKPGAQKSERYKVVLQVSDADPAKWNLALNNATSG